MTEAGRWSCGVSSHSGRGGPGMSKEVEMKRHLVPGAGVALCLVGLAAADAHAALTDGWTRYSASYGVQNRTNGASLSSRFSFSGGVYTTRVQQGEERVEMRWAGWPSQNR